MPRISPSSSVRRLTDLLLRGTRRTFFRRPTSAASPPWPRRCIRNSNAGRPPIRSPAPRLLSSAKRNSPASSSAALIRHNQHDIARSLISRHRAGSTTVPHDGPAPERASAADAEVDPPQRPGGAVGRQQGRDRRGEGIPERPAGPDPGVRHRRRRSPNASPRADRTSSTSRRCRTRCRRN